MCHFTLHIHPCGESYYTKYSSCSYDRFAAHPDSALNPLHPLAGPPVFAAAAAATAAAPSAKVVCLTTTTTATPPSAGALPLPSATDAAVETTGAPRSKDALVGRTPPAAPSSPGECNAATAKVQHTTQRLAASSSPPHAAAGAVSNASLPRGGGEKGKCYVFEVTHMKREPDDCPPCKRSLRRRRLPARARYLFAPS